MPDTSPLLVVGDDGSPPADAAWAWVNAQSWSGWAVELVTASDPPLPRPADGSPSQEWDAPWDRRLLARTGAKSIRRVRVAGDPRVVLGDRVDAQLLVIGPCGLGHLSGLWMGSTAEWLLHHPPAPLLVAHSAASVHRAVICVDGSPHALAALDAFLSLPLAATAEVALVSVDDGRTDVDRALEDAGLRVAEARSSASSVRLRGSPTRAILGHLDEVQPHLAVLGTRGLTGLAGLLSGSTAGAVTRAGACSALVSCSA